VTTVLLVRHGLTAATGHSLSGWTPGIPLDERGTAQARALAARLAGLPLDAIMSA
jgi:broad specificity phosphatase PhoE